MVEYSKVAEERAKLKFEDTNLANFGSEIEYKVKKDASEKEPAWEGTRTTIGLRIWRIEKFQVKDWPKDKYSEFYDGDSYIILNTFKDPNGEALIHHAFMWIGTYSTQDEYGTAAYKIVELDDYLDRKATLFREVQDHECPSFLALFKSKITILQGGVATGFTHVEKTEYPSRLFQICGTGLNAIRISEVPLKIDSLNNEDVFVLDKGTKVFNFKGEKSHHNEKFKAAAYISSLRDSRKSVKCQVVELDSLNDTEGDAKEFWDTLGGHPDKIKAKEKEESSVTFEKKLIRVSDSTGKLEMKVEATGALKKDMLDSNDVFLLDTKDTIFAWIGKKTTSNEKKSAFLSASQYLKDNGRPGYLTISIIIEGSEVDYFLKNFS